MHHGYQDSRPVVFLCDNMKFESQFSNVMNILTEDKRGLLYEKVINENKCPFKSQLPNKN